MQPCLALLKSMGGWGSTGVQSVAEGLPACRPRPTMPPFRLYLIDAFCAAGARGPSGNPAAVVLLPAADPPLPDAARATVAAELNQSETAFVEVGNARGIGPSEAGGRRLRWFTPTTEVPLCGHATLAAAAALVAGESRWGGLGVWRRGCWSWAPPSRAPLQATTLPLPPTPPSLPCPAFRGHSRRGV